MAGQSRPTYHAFISQLTISSSHSCAKVLTSEVPLFSMRPGVQLSGCCTPNHLPRISLSNLQPDVRYDESADGCAPEHAANRWIPLGPCYDIRFHGLIDFTKLELRDA